MRSIARLAGPGAFVVALALVAPGVAIGAGMGGMGAAGAMGGPGMMGGGMSTNTMSPVAGSRFTNPDDRISADPSVRNLSHTGLRMPMRASKAWQDVPLSDPDAGGALAPVPALAPDVNTSK